MGIEKRANNEEAARTRCLHQYNRIGNASQFANDKLLQKQNPFATK